MTRQLRLQRQRRLQLEQSANGGIVKHKLDRLRETNPDAYNRIMLRKMEDEGGIDFLAEQMNPKNRPFIRIHI